MGTKTEGTKGPDGGAMAPRPERGPRNRPMTRDLLIGAVTAVTGILVWGLLVTFHPSSFRRPPDAVPAAVSDPVPAAVVFVSANGDDDSPWIASGTRVKKGDRVRIEASGKISTSFHHMLRAAENDSLPVSPWTGPAGLNRYAQTPVRDARSEDVARDKYLICPETNPGALLAIVADGKPADPHVSGKKHKVHPPKRNKQGAHATIEFEAEIDGSLFFAINDVWLTTENRAAYDGNGKSTEVGPDGNPQKSNRMTWEDVVARYSYWNLWYDDNSGGFLAVVYRE